MEIYNLPEDVRVFGFRVTGFPAGVEEAFQSLIQTLPGGFDRPYYGISYLDDEGQMAYHATALEKYEGEADKYHYTTYVIEKGEYIAVTVDNWRAKTACIKDVFHEIIGDDRVDKTKPAVEWYKDNNEMVCMVHATRQKKETTA